MSKNFTGTVKELSGAVSLNGHRLKAGDLSNLVQMGLISVASKVQVAAKGKPAYVLSLTSNDLLSFESVEQVDATASA